MFGIYARNYLVSQGRYVPDDDAPSSNYLKMDTFVVDYDTKTLTSPCKPLSGRFSSISRIILKTDKGESEWYPVEKTCNGLGDVVNWNWKPSSKSIAKYPKLGGWTLLIVRSLPSD